MKTKMKKKITVLSWTDIQRQSGTHTEIFLETTVLRGPKDRTHGHKA